MHDSTEIEAVLARLMPPALSTSSQNAIENMLDDLADLAPTPAVPLCPSVPPLHRKFALPAAAALFLAAASIALFHANSPPPPSLTTIQPNGIFLVSESDRVESITDEGWGGDLDGSAIHAVRFNLLEENNLLDEETGIVMNVSLPREEIFLMPISAF